MLGIVRPARGLLSYAVFLRLTKMLMMMLMMIVMAVAAAKTALMMMMMVMLDVMLTVATAMTTSGRLVAIRSRESTNMAHVSLSFYRCEFCGAYHLMTSAWFGEYFIMDPYTNTVYPFNEVFAHLVIIEDEDFNE